MPHPRVRKTVKWGGASLAVLLLGVWVASGWWECQYFVSNGWGGGIACGRCWISAVQGLPSSFVGFEQFAVVSAPQYRWWFEGGVWGGSWRLSIPIWLLACLAAFVVVLTLRLDARARRRANVHLCRKCTYDRTGLAPGALCPECGSPPAGS